MDGWMDGWMNGCMDGWIESFFLACLCSCLCVNHSCGQRIASSMRGSEVGNDLDVRVVEALEGEDALVRSLLSTDKGCRITSLDRRTVRRGQGSHESVYETLFWGETVVRNVSICWAPVPGTAFSAYLVADPSPTGSFSGGSVRVRSLVEPTALYQYGVNASLLGTGVPVSYHRLDRDDPLQGFSGRRASIKLSPLCFVRSDMYLTGGDGVEGAAAINRLISSGYVENGPLIPGGGIAQRPMRDMVFVSLLGAKLWGSGASLGDGVMSGVVGTPTGVLYETPARVIDKKEYDVRDQGWYAYAKVGNWLRVEGSGFRV